MTASNPVTQRFTKAQRLLTPNQFRHVFDAPARKLHQAHLMAFISPNDSEHPRIGMAITKKKVPTAVARNKIKRHIREQFRRRWDEIECFDIIFIIKKPINDLSNKELDNQINAILNKVVKKNK